MDINNLITAGTSSGMIALMYAFYKIFKHSRCKSRCCNSSMEMSVDLESNRSFPLINSDGSSNKNDSFRVPHTRQTIEQNKV